MAVPEHGLEPMDTRETLVETLVDPTPEAAAAAAAKVEVPPMTSEAKATAIKNYASHAKLDPNHVTIEMVQATSQGALYWGTVHMDMSARGAASQAMTRALKHKPDVKAMYSLMLDSFKGEFRRAWSCSKDFQFVKTTKTTDNAYRKKREDTGTYKTYLQLVQLLGGTDQPIAKEQAQNYVAMCTRDDLKACHKTLTSDRFQAPINQKPPQSRNHRLD